MRLPFYESPPSEIKIGGRIYRLRLPFGLVLRYIDLCKNPGGLRTEDVHEIALHWFVPDLKYPGEQAAGEILERIVRECINPPKKQLQARKKLPRAVDFNLDSGYIYAAFMQTYGIDLYDCSHSLPWCKFISLFEALPEDTVIRKIMDIRTRELPRPTKYNAEEIQRLVELKTLFALPGEQQEGNGWEALFRIMEKEAGNGVGKSGGISDPGGYGKP